MSLPYRLRAADARDAEAIAALHTESWRHVWRERLGVLDADRLVTVSDDGARLVGFICVFARGDEGWGAYIDSLHVVDDWKGRGVRRALMRAAGEWVCAAQPGGGVCLWIMTANAPPRAFYDRLGARNAETSTLADPGGGSAPNCRYVWPDARALL